MLYHLTSFQFSINKKPFPNWNLQWSRNDGIFNKIDEVVIREPDHFTKLLIFKNQHTATKLRLSFWHTETDYVHPCVENITIKACEANTCPPNTMEYGESCYMYIPAHIKGLDTMYHICDNFKWVEKAHQATFSDYEDLGVVTNLGYS